MNYLLSIFRYCFGLAVILVFAGAAFAQNELPQPTPNDPERQRPMILRQLGLTQEQIQQFRQVNAEWHQQRMEAQRRFREANRDLDMAIYSDKVDESLVAERLKAYQDAETELTRIRFSQELAIRKILTDDQLARFREARRRFAQARENQRQRGAQPQRGQQPDSKPAQRPGQQRSPNPGQQRPQ